MALAMDIAFLYPEVMTRLDRIMPVVVKIGVEDMKKTIKRTAEAGTPEGYRYVKIKLTKKGKVRKGTGTYKRSGAARKRWKVEKDGQGFIAVNDTPYLPVIEGGLYPGVGKKPKNFPANYPRTVSSGTGIFSTQAPSGILQPIVDDENLIDGAMNLIIDELEKRFSE